MGEIDPKKCACPVKDDIWGDSSMDNHESSATVSDSGK